MNTKHDNELEARIDRELKSLPPLAAPPTLAPRVMALVASRGAAPWYRRAWPTWPVGLQAASLVVLLVMFAGLCFAGWQVSHAASATAAAQKAGGAFSVVSVVWRTLGVLGDSAAQVIRHQGTGFVCALVVVGLAGYAMLLGLGSACYRLAYTRR
jgi:hypothetical protein